MVVSTHARGVAVVIPKKIITTAVKRHALKRKVFSALKTLSLPQAFIVFPKSSAGALTVVEIKKELGGLLSEI